MWGRMFFLLGTVVILISNKIMSKLINKIMEDNHSYYAT